MLPFYHNIPFFSILLAMVGGIITSLIKSGKYACILHTAILTITAAANGFLAVTLFSKQESFTYMLGHFPAPWGNELRAGPLEAMLVALFAVVMLMCVLGGIVDIFSDILPSKQYLYFIMLDLLWASIQVLIYTNDLFTGYVFIEINTIASCSIVMAKDTGQTNMATIRYLVMSQIGSGMFLLSLALLYGISGQLLFPSMKTAIAALAASGSYSLPFVVITGMLALGLSVKSALYPFHSWLPGAHGNATTASSAMLSGLVLKGYILLLIKVFVQVYTLPIAASTHILDVLFILGAVAMIMGSVYALKESHIKRMVAYSSVAQIGYIYLGIGMGTEAGLIAAIFQIMVHACAKPLLFICSGELSRTCGHQKQFHFLRGSAYRSPAAGIGFTVGGLSMIGLPLLGGFATKLFLGSAAFANTFTLAAAFIVLAISSVMNALYYMPAIILIWTRHEHVHSSHSPAAEPLQIGHEPLGSEDIHSHHAAPASPAFIAASVVLMAGVVTLGVAFNPITMLIGSGLQLML